MIIAPLSVSHVTIPVEDRTLFAQRRAAIDEVATTRAKVIRCGLFGTYLFRPHPSKVDSEEVKASWVKEMKIQLGGIDRACALVSGHDPKSEFSEEVCRWMAQCASQHPDEIAALKEMQKKTDELIASVPTGGALLEKRLIDHAVFGRTTFFPSVSLMCDAFWADLDLQRHAEVDRALSNNVKIGVTLKRLEHIGKHVRLVSLNASVEAARVGDAGRGLGVIAQEFKSLAEEIQHLAQSAHHNISDSGKLEYRPGQIGENVADGT